MRRTIQLAPLASLLWLASIAAAAAPTYDVHLEKDVMVPMRDGVRLATDVYLPAKDGKPLAERLPTILMRTPYNKGPARRGMPTPSTSPRTATPSSFQDTRGRYESEGVWHMLTDDGPGRLRHRRVDRQAALVQRQDRHDRHLLCRRHAARPGAWPAART